MRYTTMLATICFAAILNGCAATPMPFVSYDAQGQKTKAQPSLDTVRAGYYCSNRMGDATLEVRKGWADLMGVPVNRVPKFYCERLRGALYSGRITEDDYRSVLLTGDVSPKALKILRGG